jgi:hypothetical protein
MSCRPSEAWRSSAVRAFATLVAMLLVVGSLAVGNAHARVRVQDPTSPDATAEGGGSGATAAILPLAVDGEISEVDETALTTELVDGLRRGAFGVVDPADVARADSAAGSCANSECVKKIAAATGATHVVRARVVIEDRDYGVTVDLYDGGSGAVVASSSDNCEICGISEAGNLMASAAATLRTKLDALAQGPATLAVTSTPVGAEVRIDGQLVGTTPFEGPVIAGKHVLRLSQVDYITVEREVTFVEGVRETLAFELEKVPSRLPNRPWGWAAIGVGAAGLVTSAVFFAFDAQNKGEGRPYKLGGACDGDNVDSDGDCRQVWDTELIAYPTAIVGAALTTLGIAILLSSGKRRRAKKASEAGAATASRPNRRPRLGIGLGRVSIQGRF